MITDVAEYVADDSVQCDSNAAKYLEQRRFRILAAVETASGEIEAFLDAAPEQYDAEELHIEFENYRDQERVLSGWDPAHIVKPSGLPSQALHLKLNYPTFRMQQIEHGESADHTNNSTKLLMLKGLTAANAFWYEACFRRQAPARSRHQEVATRDWPAEVKNLHTEFSHHCELIDKKVLTLFGASNRKTFNDRYAVTQLNIRASDTELETFPSSSSKSRMPAPKSVP
ncbi:hypothetical protein BKA63DRAFT_486357 [Paraphoma chrysanthemicola]|nr:hypothetical protein BKA63DRAFT_486357 [Paraphoma chrysanthemicola]